MNKNRSQTFLLLLPIGIIAAALYGAFVPDVSVSLTAEEKTVLRFRPAASAADFEIVERTPLVYTRGIKGPFRITRQVSTPATDDTAKAVSTHHLTGIFITDEERQAVISNRFVREGTPINGKKVKKIERDRVSLDDNGETSWIILDSP